MGSMERDNIAENRGAPLHLRSGRLWAPGVGGPSAGHPLVAGAPARDPGDRLREAGLGSGAREPPPDRVPRPRMGTGLSRFSPHRTAGPDRQRVASASTAVHPLGRALAALRAPSGPAGKAAPAVGGSLVEDRVAGEF